MVEGLGIMWLGMLLGLAGGGVIGFFVGSWVEYRTWVDRGVIEDPHTRRFITNWEAEKLDRRSD